MVDFKKLLSQCGKQITFPENSLIELPKFCRLKDGHGGLCGVCQECNHSLISEHKKENCECGCHGEWFD